jgi:hypothetical protein
MIYWRFTKMLALYKNEEECSVAHTNTLTEIQKTKERQPRLSTVNSKLLQNGGAHCSPPQSA